MVMDKARVVVAAQHHADSKRMLQTGRRTMGFLSQRLPGFGRYWTYLSRGPEHVVDIYITPDVVNMMVRESNRRAHIELGSSNPPALLNMYRDTSPWLMCMHILLSLLPWALWNCRMKMTTGALIQYWPRASCRTSSKFCILESR